MLYFGLRVGDVLVHNFRLLALRLAIVSCLTVRVPTRFTGVDSRGWSTLSDGGVHTMDGRTTAGWSVVARSLRGEGYALWSQSILQKRTQHMLAFVNKPITTLSSLA